MPVLICIRCNRQVRDSFHKEPIKNPMLKTGWCDCKKMVMVEETIKLKQIGDNGIEIQFQDKREIFVFEKEELFKLLKWHCENWRENKK